MTLYGFYGCLVIDEEFVVLSDSVDAFWTTVFSKYFIHPGTYDLENSDSRDDLLFFVRNQYVSAPIKRVGSSSNLESLVSYTIAFMIV